jgi:hypothetical protein
LGKYTNLEPERIMDFELWNMRVGLIFSHLFAYLQSFHLRLSIYKLLYFLFMKQKNGTVRDINP